MQTPDKLCQKITGSMSNRQTVRCGQRPDDEAEVVERQLISSAEEQSRKQQL
jgi:hypothetical protein